MIWRAILRSTKAPLVIWEREDWGTITGLSYCTHVLTPVLWPLWYWENQRVGSQLRLMENGASAHRARYTQAPQQEYAMPKLWWPPACPNLNPIENVWNLLKDRIEARRPRVPGLDQMSIAVWEEWDQIAGADILHFISSLSQRIEESLPQTGGILGGRMGFSLFFFFFLFFVLLSI